MRRIYRPIDGDEFRKLCSMQCTQSEIAGFFEVEDDYLNKWCKGTYGRGYKEMSAIFREQGKVSLRRIQWQWAEKSAAMAIHLGKNYLGQTDGQNIQQINAPVVIKDNVKD